MIYLHKNISEMDISEFLSHDETSSYNQSSNNNKKEKGYRKQTEYGAKKYIKP
jgi:hypothetical protein